MKMASKREPHLQKFLGFVYIKKLEIGKWETAKESCKSVYGYGRQQDRNFTHVIVLPI